MKLHRDAMDEYSGGRDSELMYETTSGSGSYDVQFCMRASDSQHIRYSFYITSSKNIFGSIGLRRKEHCILNKEYSKEEYEKLVPRITDHMKSTGEFGEFFPAELSPFAYNETVAQEYFPLNEKDAASLGYSWRTFESRAPGEKTVNIPDRIDAVTYDILEQKLCCEKCNKYYKVVFQELKFYREHRIPVPALCVDCRHAARLQVKNPPTLRLSTCRHCSNEISTSFPPDAPEIVVCEECYLKEVY